MSHFNSLLVDSTHTVERTLRPLRFAFILKDEVEKKQLHEIVKWSSNSLGGMYFGIFTLSSLEKMLFKNILKNHDPDYFICDSEDTSKKLLTVLQNISEQRVWVWNEVKNNELIRVTIDSKLKTMDKKDELEKINVTGTKFTNEYYYLSLGLNGVWPTDSEKISDFAEPNVIDLSNNNLNELLTIQTKYGIIQSYLLRMSASWGYRSRVYDSDELMSEPTLIFVVGDYTDIQSFCLYWNLRAIYSDKNLLWVTKKMFENDCDQILEFGFNMSYNKRTGIITLSDYDPIIELLNKSTFNNKREQKQGTLLIYFELKNNEYELYLNETDFESAFGSKYVSSYGETDKIIVKFDKRFVTLDVVRPSYFELDDRRLFAVDYGFNYFRNYPSINLSYRMGLTGPNRLTVKGLTIIKGGYFEDNPHYKNVNLLTMFDSLKYIFQDFNVRIEKSDKGKRAENFMGLLNYYWELRVISGESIIKLIKKMNPFERIEGSTRKKSKVEVALKYGTIQNILKIREIKNIDKNIGNKYMKWFINKRLLQVGTLIKCEFCYNKQWVSINDIKKIIKCDGCFNDIVLPSGNYNHISLRYAINDLLGSSIDQGFLSHLLTFHYLFYRSNIGNNGFTQFYPGINFFEKETHIGEMDLIIIHSGEIISCECKNGRDIDLAEIRKAIILSERIGSDAIIFSNLGTFSDDCKEHIKSESKNTKLKVRVLEHNHLFNQCEHKQRFREISSERGDEKSDHQVHIEEISKLL